MKSSFFPLALVVCAIVSVPSLAVAGTASVAAKTLKVSEITTLDKNEPEYESQAFHDDLLWVGRSACGGATCYQIEAYRPDGTKAAEPLKIPHTPEFIRPFGAHAVIVVGKHQSPYWRTYYTIVRNDGGQLTGRRYVFPDTVMAHDFGGTPDAMFFADPGSQAIFSFQRQPELETGDMGEIMKLVRDDSNDIEDPPLDLPDYMHQLALKVHGPQQMLLADGNLFVIESYDIMSGRTGITKIDPTAETQSRTFKFVRNLLTTMVALPGKRVAVTERGADQVLLVHTDTNTVNEAENLKVPGLPWGAATFGSHCLAVMAERGLALHIFDVAKPGNPEVAVWDVSTPINRFYRPRAISSDPRSGTIFVRSNDICPTCQVSFNKEFAVAESSGSTLKQCR